MDNKLRYRNADSANKLKGIRTRFDTALCRDIVNLLLEASILNPLFGLSSGCSAVDQVDEIYLKFSSKKVLSYTTCM